MKGESKAVFIPFPTHRVTDLQRTVLILNRILKTGMAIQKI